MQEYEGCLFSELIHFFCAGSTIQKVATSEFHRQDSKVTHWKDLKKGSCHFGSTDEIKVIVY